MSGNECPVLSGLLNAIPVITINPLYQKDLQQFSPCIRPDTPDIPPNPVTFVFFASSFALFAVILVASKAPSSVFSAFYPNVLKCPVLSGLPNAPPVSTINPLYQQYLQ